MLRLDHFWNITRSHPVVFSVIVLIIPLMIKGFTLPLPYNELVPTTSSMTLADLEVIKSPLRLKDHLSATGINDYISDITFVVTTSTTAPVSLTDGAFAIDYRDNSQRHSNVAWSWQFQGIHNHDAALDPGEQLQVTLPLANLLEHPLGPNQQFVIELKPAQGAILSLRHTTPAHIGAHMSF